MLARPTILLLYVAQVCLAVLLGSDYTEGVAGIGVVNALEVVSAWPGGLAGLQQFRAWLEGPDERLLEAAAKVSGKQQAQQKQKQRQQKSDKQEKRQTKRKRSKKTESRGDGKMSESEGDGGSGRSDEEEWEADAEGGGSRGVRGSQVRGRGRGARASSGTGRKRVHFNDERPTDEQTGTAVGLDAQPVQEPAAGVIGGEQPEVIDITQEQPGQQAVEETPAQRQFKRSHRGVQRNWQLPPSFPSQRVLEAYLRPLVDRNTARFSCGQPDTQLLTQFCRWVAAGACGQGASSGWWWRRICSKQPWWRVGAACCWHASCQLPCLSRRIAFLCLSCPFPAHSIFTHT